MATCCGGGGGGTDGATRPIAILSAFPGELAALVERADIRETTTIEGLENQRFRLGRIGATPVLLGMTAIGLANAGATTRAVLDNFDVAGVIVSGVAGSPYRIGDVTVPESWVLDDGSRFAADAGWLETARRVESRGLEDLARCVVVPRELSPDPVCLAHEPTLIVGGVGHSSDPFGDNPFPCQIGADDVFGCDIVAQATAPATTALAQKQAAAIGEVFVAEDMESAAIAREVTARGLPFIAFRATSDGSGDPLGLPGFPAQFFAYYPLAAENAARAVVAFVNAHPAQ